MADAVFPTPFVPKGFALTDGNLLNTLFGNPAWSSQTGITALAGGTRAATTPVLGATVSNLTTVATAADSVVLPASKAGNIKLVLNNGASAAQLFANGSDTIDGVAGATGVSIPAGTNLLLVCAVAGKWDSIGGDTVGAFTSLVLSGATSGTTTVNPAAIAAGTLTLPPITGTVASTTGTNLFITDIYRTSAPVTKNANVTPATVTGLSGAVAVGTYAFRAYLPSTVASGTGGIAYNFLLTTAVLSAMECSGHGFTASAVAVQHTTTATSGTALFTQAAVVISVLLEGTFVVSTAGTFAIQMCQNTSNASDTVALLGGYLELTRIA